MRSAGIRSLKAHLSSYLAGIKEGHPLLVTDRGREIAIIVPLRCPLGRSEGLLRLMQAGELLWSGSKPSAASPPVSIKGRGLSQTILEDRG